MEWKNWCTSARCRWWTGPGRAFRRSGATKDEHEHEQENENENENENDRILLLLVLVLVLSRRSRKARPWNRGQRSAAPIPGPNCRPSSLSFSMQALAD